MAEVPPPASAATVPGASVSTWPAAAAKACQGDGMVKVEMHFLPDVYVPCDVCHGQRYNRETLEVLWKGKNIAQILDLTVEAAARLFPRRPGHRAQAADPAGRGPVLHPPGPERDHAVGRRGAAREAGAGVQARHRSNALHPGRTHDRLHFADIDLLLRCCTTCATPATPSW